MKPYCVNSDCIAYKDPEISPIRNGLEYRKSDKKYEQKYKCKLCKSYFNASNYSSSYKQKKRNVNLEVLELLTKGFSQRAIARHLGLNKNTIRKKIKYLASLCREEIAQLLKQLGQHESVNHIQMDEMETFEHTKMKPISIPLVVDQKTRLILGVDACKAPAKGLLAEKSRKKYGKREDERRACFEGLLKGIPINHHVVLIESDECPRYPPMVRKVFPTAKHVTYKGRRGCVVGQGELKAGGFDPLFSLNHTCAMFRDNLKTLSRRTWCTVKRLEYFKDLLTIYAYSHNRRILQSLSKKGHVLGGIKVGYSFR